MQLQVAIIGAGIAGLSLALCLADQGIECSMFEARAAPLDIGVAIMLSPNALRIFDKLGVYEQLRTLGYSFDTLYFRKASGELIDTYEFGSRERYGYSGLRIYRYQLINGLVEAIRLRSIPLSFGRKYSHVINETNEDVTWQFTDGTTSTASLLIGADGIHSRVRRYMFPDLEPSFTGMAGITAAVPASQLKLPTPDYQMPVTIMCPGAGAFVIAPQQADGSEVLIGKQIRMAEQTREGWERVYADKEASISFLQENAGAFGEIAVTAASHIEADKINVWPFHLIPRLDSWTSQHRKVILVGDSAHAIPPSAGQGINQALEDVFMLALLLRQGKNIPRDLDFWQGYRTSRIARVLSLNAQIDPRRLPEGCDTKEINDGGFNLAWLYGIDIQDVVNRWVAGAGT